MISSVRHFSSIARRPSPNDGRFMKRRPPQALFSFGVVADVQYGDKVRCGKRIGASIATLVNLQESKASSSRPEALMQYRKGIARLNTAIQEMQRRREELTFAVSLGDVIDGNDTDVRLPTTPSLPAPLPPPGENPR